MRSPGARYRAAAAALAAALSLAAAVSVRGGEGQLPEAMRRTLDDRSWAGPPERDADKDRRAAELITRASDLLDEDKFLDAAFAAEEAAKLQPDNPRGYNIQATALNRLGKFREAEEASRGSLRVNRKDNSAAYDNLAWAQLNMGRYQEAADSALSAIVQSTDNAKAYVLLAFAYEGTGDHDRKLASIRKAVELAPGNRSFKKMLRAAESSGGRMFAPQRAPVGDDSGAWGRELTAVALGAFILLAACLIGIGYFYLASKSRAGRPPVAAADDSGPSEEGERLLAGKYELVRIIGKGGMGEVWDARDQTLNRRVAIKKMTEKLGALGSQGREYYLKEARTVAALHHPHIIAIYEIIDLQSGIYLVFELASGKTVQHLLAEQKRLPLRRVKQVLRPVCAALDFAHARGIVHRDLKPANIMITDQGFVKVMDFGIARRVEEKVEAPEPDAGRELPDLGGIPVDHTRTIVGTPVYMAPEAERGVVTSVSDIYMLGTCFYEMLIGVLPYGPEAGALKYERNYVKPTRYLPDLPPAVDQLVEDALDPNPETRIPSAREFVSRMDQIRGPESA